jgi:transcriptional regulator with XRE-family HTH domain
MDPAFGARLRELRVSRGLSLRDLAKLALSSKSHIQEFESGKSVPRTETVVLLDEALQAGGVLVALARQPPPDQPAGKPAGVRTVDSTWGLMLRQAVHLAAPPLTAYLEMPGPSGRLGDETVTGLAEVAAHYRRAYHTVPASRLLPAASAHLDLVMALRPGRQPDRQRSVLLTTAGEMAALVGVLLAMDATQYSSALSYLDLAWQAARAAEDTELQTVVLGCRSFAISYGGGDHQAGLECVDFAREVAAVGACAQTRGWVAAVASERCASVGDLSGCQRRLAESLDALATEDRRVIWRGIGGFNADKLRAYEGGDLVRLGRFGDAEPILDEALHRLSGTMQRHRATALVDRAEARLGAGEVDAACADATEALRLVTQVQHAGNFARVDGVARRGVATGARSARTLRREVQLARADYGLPIRGRAA